MKFLSSFFFSFLISTMGYSIVESENCVEKPQTANEQIRLATLFLQSKYDMEIILAENSKEDGLDTIMVVFERKSKLVAQQEARAMIIDCTHTYLKAMNLNKSDWLQRNPFTEKDIQIFIAFVDYEKIEDPILALVGLDQGIIHYTPNISNPLIKIPCDKEFQEETYEKALELLHIQKPVFK